MDEIKYKNLKTMNFDEIDALCKDIRQEIIDSTFKNGGHLSSNLGAIELTVAIHKYFDLSKDKLLFDVGHQCYTHKILTGRSLENLRKSNGVAGFPKLSESKFDNFEGGHSSNSISNALGFAIARDLNNDKYDIITVIGDASISNGLAFEALNDTRLADHKIIIILNDNGMSISQNVGAISKLFSRVSTSGLYNKTKLGYKRFSAKTKFGRKFYEFLFSVKNSIKRFLIRGNFFIDLGINYIGIVDGHNVKAIEKAFKRAQKSVKTTIIHLKTKKGLGYKAAEDDIFGYYHGVNPKKDNNETISWSEFYSNQFENIIKKDEKVVLISPATLVGSKLEKLQESYPNRVFDVGIAEEHAASFAAGLSLSGYKPYISIYSTFLQRAFDEISHDIARMNLNVTLLIDRCGLANGDGDTHQGIFDESFLLNTPNTTVCMASNNKIGEFLIANSSNAKNLYCIRYPKSNVKIIEKEINLLPYKWIYEKNVNSDTVLITFGPIINEFIEKIEQNKINIDVINAIYQNPIDKEFIKNIKEKYKKIVIYNIYGTENGFNNLVLNELNKLNYKGEIISKALELTFESTQSIDESLKKEHLDIDTIIELLK